MKFTLPVSPPQELLQGIGSTRMTWEYRWATNAVVAQLFVGSGIIAWFWRFLPPEIPLWYSRPWGQERLASPWFLFLPLATAVLVYIINLMLIAKFASQHPMFTRVLLLTSLLVSCLSGAMVIRIVTLIS